EVASRSGVVNVEFETADAYDLPCASGSFDVGYMAAVFGNLREPDRAAAELHRVLKVGGLVAVREFDHGVNSSWPPNESRERAQELYHRLRQSNGHNAMSGRRVRELLERAGFRGVSVRGVCVSAGDEESATACGRETALVFKEAFVDRFIEKGWIDTN